MQYICDFIHKIEVQSNAVPPSSSAYNNASFVLRRGSGYCGGRGGRW